MMWCYCHHLHGISNLRDLTLEDNFNNTFQLKSSSRSHFSPGTFAKIMKRFRFMLFQLCFFMQQQKKEGHYALFDTEYGLLENEVVTSPSLHLSFSPSNPLQNLIYVEMKSKI